MRNQRSPLATCKSFIYPAGRRGWKARFHSFPWGSVNWYPTATLLFPYSILGAISHVDGNPCTFQISTPLFSPCPGSGSRRNLCLKSKFICCCCSLLWVVHLYELAWAITSLNINAVKPTDVLLSSHAVGAGGLETHMSLTETQLESQQDWAATKWWMVQLLAARCSHTKLCGAWRTCLVLHVTFSELIAELWLAAKRHPAHALNLDLEEKQRNVPY